MQTFGVYNSVSNRPKEKIHVLTLNRIAKRSNVEGLICNVYLYKYKGHKILRREKIYVVAAL